MKLEIVSHFEARLRKLKTIQKFLSLKAMATTFFFSFFFQETPRIGEFPDLLRGKNKL